MGTSSYQQLPPSGPRSPGPPDAGSRGNGSGNGVLHPAAAPADGGDIEGEVSELLGKGSRDYGGGSASLLSCISNLMNTILGTGMLAMPHSVASAGLIPGVLLIMFSGLLAFFGLYLLTRSASLTRPTRSASFNSIAELAYPKATMVFDAAIAIKCAGVACSYLIIVGGLMPKVVLSFNSSPPEWLLDRGFWIVVSMVILTPLCYLKQLNSLRFTSYIAMLAVVDLIVVVIYKYFSSSQPTRSAPVRLFVFDTTLLSSVPVFVFAFTCAQNVFSCYNEVKTNNQKRMNIVTSASIGSAAVIYLIIGVLGYLTFGDKVPSNLMTAYKDSIFINVCRAGLVLLVLFGYPLQILPCRNSLSHLLTAEEGPIKHIFLTTFLLLGTFLIAMNVSQLELVLGIIGSTGSTTISFILPAIFYLKLFPEYVQGEGPPDFGSQEAGKRRNRRRSLAKALLVLGFVIMVVCLGVVVYHAVSRK